MDRNVSTLQEYCKTLQLLLTPYGEGAPGGTPVASPPAGGSVAHMDVLKRARLIADEVLFPVAAEVDMNATIPPEHFDLLADKGFYGFAGPVEAGGMGVDLITASDSVEALAGGCLATTLVWLQHHSAVRAASESDQPGIREEWLGPLCRGERRASVARTGLRPGPPSVRVRAVPGGFQFNGTIPWVTGWGYIDTIQLAARTWASDTADTIFVFADAEESDTLIVEPQNLVAVNGSHTATLRLNGHFVPEERLTHIMTYADWLGRDAAGLRLNGSLPLGIAARCCRLLNDLYTFDQELADCRDALRTGSTQMVPAAIAAASALAMRITNVLVVAAGTQAVVVGEHPQRLVREALFLLVNGSRPAIREALMDDLLSPGVALEEAVVPRTT